MHLSLVVITLLLKSFKMSRSQNLNRSNLNSTDVNRNETETPEDITTDFIEEADRKSDIPLTYLCAIILLLMFVLILLSDWTDLTDLLETPRHQMIIIQM